MIDWIVCMIFVASLGVCDECYPDETSQMEPEKTSSSSAPIKLAGGCWRIPPKGWDPWESVVTFWNLDRRCIECKWATSVIHCYCVWTSPTYSQTNISMLHGIESMIWASLLLWRSRPRTLIPPFFEIEQIYEHVFIFRCFLFKQSRIQSNVVLSTKNTSRQTWDVSLIHLGLDALEI